ncbi:uncharacterized protein K02A2.6-like [Xenopus tropicalis]|uniref:Gypsy retrotransposon integrase-like protein 1 n=1 Tax=Xenopus tropicalis TaxID=8364 RepID=A0A8J0SYY8_XENTR|nr:uncharacterized protein K02A2.6-like [Xenopus tropicalis]|eukprot:XP_012826093.1 PREDICTED: uncharacterized protein K02A2.6-like [Xenopus tropicalis]
MATIIGQIDTFDEAREQWTTYVERFEHFVKANDIDEGKTVSVFLSVMGASTYGLLRSLIAPVKPGTMSYGDIVNTLQAHFSPRPIVIAERFKFHKRNQAEGESVAQYVAVLKKLAEHCEFGDNLNDALRDRVVCGLCSESIQRKLLTESALTYQKAVDIAMSMEAVSRESQHLSNSLKVNAMSFASESPKAKCFRCGKSNHTQNECFYKDQLCHNCGKKGHIARSCKGAKTEVKIPRVFGKGNYVKSKGMTKKKTIHKMGTETERLNEETSSDTESELTLHNVTATSQNPAPGNIMKRENEEGTAVIKIQPKIEGLRVEMEVDTGAAVSIISGELYRDKLSHIRLRHTNVVLKTYTGEVIRPEGVIKVCVKLNKQRARLPLYIVTGNAVPLFGRELLRRIHLDWREIKSITAVHRSNEGTLDSLLKQHEKVFSEELGTFNGYTATINLKPGTQPKFFQARVVPYAIRPKVEEEINHLLKQGIISPVRFSEWATPIVPVIKKGGNVRICGDFKVTVNPALCAEHYPLPRIEDLFASLAGGKRFSKLDLSQAYLQIPVHENSRLVNYYARFVPNLSTVLHPLNTMLHKEVKWNWSPECEGAFQEIKRQLLTPNVLTHYDPRLPVRLACDASPYGVGAVLSHLMPDGQERPIAFASRTLSKAEQNYAQLEREALGLIFGVRKFHTYLYGRHFTLMTDHRPLTTILHPHKATPSMAAARLQRWALLLAAHNYTIQYRSADKHGNADSLSRLPLPVHHKDRKDALEVYFINKMDTLPVSSSDIRKGTRTDPILCRVKEMVSTGLFPPTKDSENVLKPYLMRKEELSLLQDCLMWGQRVIVPPNLRPQVLEDLHTGHPGVVKMKALARSYIWWPNIDSQIEEKSKTCMSCQQNQKSPALSPLHPWAWPESPWQRIHIDYAGPFEGRMFLVVVDAHSKWPEVLVMDSTTSCKTIEVLRGLFSRYGIPETLVSDNGPQFTSEEFECFLKSNGVKHVRSAPFHPATNGLAERFVQTFKHSLKASKEPKPLQQRLDAFLLQYRNTPHSTTKEAPAMLFLHRRLRTRLDLIKPSVKQTVEQAQEVQCSYRALHAKERDFGVGDSVLVRDYRRGGEKWKTGTVSSQSGPVSYTVQVDSAQTWKRHADQMLGGHPEITKATELLPADNSVSPILDNREQELPLISNETVSYAPDQHADGLVAPATVISQNERRFPVRNRKAPNRLDL